MTSEKLATPKTAKSVTDHRERALYAISVAAELTGVHPQTLRMYERRGLLHPQRTDGMTRRYSQRDIEHVRMIQKLTQEHGMNLAGVERWMEMSREIEAIREQMDRMREEMDQMRRSTAIVPLRDAQFDPRRLAKDA